MFNSSPKSFLLTLAVTTALMAAASLAAAILVDPFAFLAAEWPSKPRICAPGLRGRADVGKLALARLIRPREVLLGTSRVQQGFGEADARHALDARVANLATSAASIEEVALLLRRSATETELRRAWIGVDFRMFFNPDPPRTELAIVAAQSDRLRWLGPFAALRPGAFDVDAIRAAGGALVSPGECATPRLTLSGFEPATAGGGGSGLDRHRFAASVDLHRRALLRAAQADRPTVLRLYRARVAQLGLLLREARRRGVRVVLFLNPSHPIYSGLLHEAGLEEAHRRWREDMRAVAAAAGEGIVLIEPPEAEWAAKASAPACRAAGVEPGCPFLDVIHYRPWVGRLILEQGAGR